MSTPGRPKCESRSAQHAAPMSTPGHPKSESRSAQHAAPMSTGGPFPRANPATRSMEES